MPIITFGDYRRLCGTRVTAIDHLRPPARTPVDLMAESVSRLCDAPHIFFCVRATGYALHFSRNREKARRVSSTLTEPIGSDGDVTTGPWSPTARLLHDEIDCKLMIQPRFPCPALRAAFL